MKIIDTHAHLDHLDDWRGALERAVDAGVEAIVAMSMDLASCRNNLEIKRKVKEPRIYLAMGMHPSEANLEDLEACVKLIQTHRQELSAIGEVGLDFWYKWVRDDDKKKQEQQIVFRTFLELGKDLDLPVVIHSRGAWQESLAMVQQTDIKSAEFHWYSGPLDILDHLLEKGYFISATPSIAYSPHSQAAVRRAPLTRTLIETDTPVYYRDKNNKEGFPSEPRDIVRTLKAYCDLKHLDPQETLAIFNQNARAFFNMEDL